MSSTRLSSSKSVEPLTEAGTPSRRRAPRLSNGVTGEPAEPGGLHAVLVYYVMLSFRGFAWGRISGPAAVGFGGWAVAMIADHVNDVPAVMVTGAAGANIRWCAVVQGSEVVY